MILHTAFRQQSQPSNLKKNMPRKIPSIYDVLVPNRLNYTNVSMMHRPEYEFTETYRIADTESFVASSMRKKQALIQKDGYDLLGPDQDDIDYIRNRLAEIEYVTGKSFNDLLQQMIRSIVFNHNCFIYKVRDKKSSTGLPNIANKIPLAGFYVLPEFKVSVIEDVYSETVGYRYNIQNMVHKLLGIDDIYHYHVDMKPGMHVGTPPLESVKDDILSLRQIEESLERLIYKLTVPLIHLKVGSELKPASIDRQTGKAEVDIYNDLMLNMDEAGGITTSERVEIKMIGAESQALRLETPIQHYVDRVLVGLNVSEVDLGIGNSTTGGAATVISNSLTQNVQMYQHITETYITETIICDLLLESEKYKDRLFLKETEKVRFKWQHSNLDLKIKTESHMLNEVQNGVLKPNEYRSATGRVPMTEEELSAHHPSQLELDNNKINATNKARQDTAKGNKAASNKAQPTNQHTKKISDKLDTYVQLISDGNKELATEILYLDICDQIGDKSIEEQLHLAVSSLTTTLETYIIKNIPAEIAAKTADSVLSMMLFDIYTENKSNTETL